MGSNWMITGLRAYESLDDILASGSTGKTSNAMCLLRTAKFLFEYSLSNWGMVTQHEIFGHGARAREFHLSNISYDINIFHGTTYFSSQGYSSLNVIQKSALAAGGMEATSVLAGQMEQTWLNSDTIDRRDATFYLVNSLDQSMYIFGTSDSEFHADNDVQSYINLVNQWQGSQALTLDKLKTKILWDWFDPMIYLSLGSIYNYIASGEPLINFGTLHIKDMRYMPTTRTLLAPWGVEFQLQNHLHTPENKYYGLFLRAGRTGGVNSYGVDFQIMPMQSYPKWSVSNKLSVWYQPHIVKNTTAATNINKFGGADFIRATYNVNNAVKSYAELGWKTSGYLPGVQLAGGWIWRVGFKFSLDIPKA